MNVQLADRASWAETRIVQQEIDRFKNSDKCFIDEETINDRLESNKMCDWQRLRNILDKSLSIQALSLNEAAYLLNVQDESMWHEMEQVASEIKKKVYDNRIVTFAPLYLSNFCINNCLYCGFRKENSVINRRCLSLKDVRSETEVLAGKIGHKRLIVVYGEHPRSGVDYIASTIREIYDVKVKTANGFGQIRRVNVNAAPMQIGELEILKESGIGTYQVFQETYHRQTYSEVHPKNTVKGNYEWRLYCMHRAFEAGIDDVGIGVLFGLYDWRFEVMGLLSHSLELEKKFGVGPHTISFPRLEPATKTPFISDSKYKVTDKDFRKLVTVIRLSVPYTGMILTARESPAIRKEILPIGCTQTDASSRIGIGSYSDIYAEQDGKRQQFILGDTSSLDSLIGELADAGYITSFCTAGYRCGRTGKCIMNLLKCGKEGHFCKLNAILTFREWLDDFASPKTMLAGERIIKKEIDEVKEKLPDMFPQLVSYYERIKSGERDLYF